MKTISAKQLNILSCIYKAINSNGFPPTVREIAEMAGLASASSAHNYLKQLEEKGYIRRVEGSPRAIEIM